MRMSKTTGAFARESRGGFLAVGYRVVGQTGLEPVTPRLSSVCSNQLSYRPFLGDGAGGCLAAGGFGDASGGNRIRTGDPLLAKQMLYQLSYAPELFRETASRRRKIEMRAARPVRRCRLCVKL